MLPGRMPLQLVAFATLSVGVAANVFFLQSREKRSEVAESAPWSLASAETADVGDTGSIEPSSAGREAAKAKIAAVSGGLEHPAVVAGSPIDVTRAVQRELQIRGYETGAQDGVAGLMTRGAILAFEYDHGLPLSARPSQELLKSILLGDGRTPSAKRPAGTESAQAEEVIRSVQRSLAKLGYRPGPANGKLTDDTAHAIRAFEIDQTLAESGRVSGPLISRLARLSSEGTVASSP
jgi:peptidoglycan hydrolase-like protein with peptidoglycan-binding domain